MTIPFKNLWKYYSELYALVNRFLKPLRQMARSTKSAYASKDIIGEVIMSLWKPWIALSLIFLHPPLLFGANPLDHSIEASSNQPPSGPPGAPGPNGRDAPDEYIWAQSFFYGEDDPSTWIDLGTKITFEDPGVISNGILYANGDFTLNAGIYQATFQGYLVSVFLGNGPPMGIQFFLNDTAIGRVNYPLIAQPSGDYFRLLYPIQVQAIFEVSADGSIFSVQGVGSADGEMYLDSFGGTASASVMIVKLADLVSP